MTRTRLRHRLLPHPLLTLTLAVAWLLLSGEPSVGSLVMGLILGVALPILTQPFWPDRPRIERPGAILAYGAIVLWDIVVANIEVAALILFRRPDELRSGFIAIPLDLTNPEAIATLAGTITMTPGTLSADLSADGRVLLVHALDIADAEALVASIKQRYERRLAEIFAC